MCLIWWNPLSSSERSFYSAASGGQGHILCAAVSPPISGWNAHEPRAHPTGVPDHPQCDSCISLGARPRQSLPEMDLNVKTCPLPFIPCALSCSIEMVLRDAASRPLPASLNSLTR